MVVSLLSNWVRSQKLLTLFEFTFNKKHLLDICYSRSLSKLSFAIIYYKYIDTATYSNIYHFKFFHVRHRRVSVEIWKYSHLGLTFYQKLVAWIESFFLLCSTVFVKKILEDFILNFELLTYPLFLTTKIAETDLRLWWRISRIASSQFCPTPHFLSKFIVRNFYEQV